MVKEVESQLRQVVMGDPFGRYFATGYLHLDRVERKTTVERSTIDTLYAHLLLWKPLLHALVKRALWDRDHFILYTNYELRRDAVVFTFEEFCQEYNNILLPLVSKLERDDLHPDARKPMTVETLRSFYKFCTEGEGKSFVRLNTTYRDDVLRSLEAKLGKPLDSSQN